MLKKWIFLVMTLAMLLAILAACGGNSPAQQQSSSGNGGGEPKQENQQVKGTNADDYPNKPIQVIVAYEAGGGTDVGARILLPFVEKELGVSMNVINKPGGGGWIGWTELAHAEPDGYTIGYINTPNLMTGYLNPEFKRKENLDSFSPIANHVTDPGAIAIRVDEQRFTNIQELMEYAKQHELTATSTGVGSDDHYASLKLNHRFGTKFKPVHNKGAADSRAAVLGGHIDVLFANVGELTTFHKDGQIKVVAVMAKERSPFLPDVPTLVESGFEVYSASSRGLAAPAGIAPEKLEILRAAFEKGIKNEEQIKKMGEMGLQVDYKDGEEYMQLLKSDEQGVLELRDLLGW